MKLLLAAIMVCFSLPAWGAIERANFDEAYQEVIKPHELGFQADPGDKGNYYKGKLIGTNRGICAATYEGEIERKGWNMRTLTEEQAKFFIKRDFWDRYHLGDIISQGHAEELCDELVNQGPGGVHNLLVAVEQKMIWALGHPLPFHDIDSPQAIAWLNEFTANRANRMMLYDAIKLERAKFYMRLAQKNPKRYNKYLASYMARALEGPHKARRKS